MFHYLKWQSVINISEIKKRFRGVFKKQMFVKSHKIFARAGSRRLHMATPSICWYMMLSQLNSTALIALYISWQNVSLEKLGGVKLLLYKASALLCGALVNKLLMSRKQRKIDSELMMNSLSKSKGKRAFDAVGRTQNFYACTK